MAHYLITGGAGFIGSNIAQELLKRGEKVRVLDNFSTGKRENVQSLGDQIEVIEGDIRSYHIVREAVDSVDFILHQAALPSVPRSVKDPITSNEVNVSGALNVLMAARDAGVQRLVFASSSSVYGNNPELPKHEAMTPMPLSPYAVSKLTGEYYAQVFFQLYGLETICLRYFNVFGPRQDPNSQYSAVIPKFIQAMLKDERPMIYGDGEQSRDFTFIDNVIQANIRAAQSAWPSQSIMNCACHDRVTLNELIEKLNIMLGKNIVPIYAEPRRGDVKHSFASIERAQENIGYIPGVKFDDGLAATIQWYTEKEVIA